MSNVLITVLLIAVVGAVTAERNCDCEIKTLDSLVAKSEHLLGDMLEKCGGDASIQTEGNELKKKYADIIEMYNKVTVTDSCRVLIPSINKFAHIKYDVKGFGSENKHINPCLAEETNNMYQVINDHGMRMLQCVFKV